MASNSSFGKSLIEHCRDLVMLSKFSDIFVVLVIKINQRLFQHYEFEDFEEIQQNLVYFS